MNELEERIKKRRERRNRRRLFSFLGFILVIIYIPAIWNWAFSANYEIGAIKTATLEIKVPIKGVLIRNEILMKPPGDGVVIPEIQNGERVAKGKTVASYIEAGTREVVENYRQTEIEILKRVVAEFDNSAGAERELWEERIEKQIAKLADIANTGDLSGAGSIRSAVDNVLEAKAVYLLEGNDLNGSLKSEKQELERLKSSLKKSVTDINSSSSGVVSYYFDGFEEAYTLDNRTQVTLEQIDEVLAAGSLTNNWLTPAEILAKRDQNFCKIISNNEAWITFYLPSKQGKEIALSFEKAKMENKELSYGLELEGESEHIPLILEDVQEMKDGFTIITARMTKYIEKTMNFRGFTGNLVLQSVTGMKVPIRSLFNENTVDHTADIAVVEMNKAVFKRVQIAGTQDSYAIIENIDATDAEKCVNVFDIYLVNPKNVAEGQVVEK